VSTSVLVLIVVGYQGGALAGIGWGGGEYAHLFAFAAIGLVVAGALMLAFGGRTPWRAGSASARSPAASSGSSSRVGRWCGSCTPSPTEPF
jgi:hypothetical protein